MTLLYIGRVKLCHLNFKLYSKMKSLYIATLVGQSDVVIFAYSSCLPVYRAKHPYSLNASLIILHTYDSRLTKLCWQSNLSKLDLNVFLILWRFLIGVVCENRINCLTTQEHSNSLSNQSSGLLASYFVVRMTHYELVTVLTFLYQKVQNFNVWTSNISSIIGLSFLSHYK